MVQLVFAILCVAAVTGDPLPNIGMYHCTSMTYAFIKILVSLLSQELIKGHLFMCCYGANFYR